jgi:hypothetical protein
MRSLPIVSLAQRTSPPLGVSLENWRVWGLPSCGLTSLVLVIPLGAPPRLLRQRASRKVALSLQLARHMILRMSCTIFGANLAAIERDGAAEVTLGGRSFEIKKGFIDDVSTADLDVGLGALRKALLVLHAPNDAMVGIENASAIFMAAKRPKSFVTLDNADHLLTRAEDAEYTAEVIATWLSRYLDLGDVDTSLAAPEGVVRAWEAGALGFLQDITAGSKRMLADEPNSFGGTDFGFTPYPLVCWVGGLRINDNPDVCAAQKMALGSCVR